MESFNHPEFQLQDLKTSDPMNIVVTEALTMGPEISWEPLKAFGNLTIHDSTTPDLVAERLRQADIAVINKARITPAVLEQCASLKLVTLTATGHDCVDKTASKAKGVLVANVPEYGTHTVAQFTWSLILELAHRVGHHGQLSQDGSWSKSPVFCLWRTPQVELAGKTLGLVGVGRIGAQVARIAQAMDLKVIALPGPSGKVPAGVTAVTLDQLLEQSDIISLHCPLNDSNRHLINRETLVKMKPGAWLINTARGGLIDDLALREALISGKPSQAALDVLLTEPPSANHPLFGLPNCLVTPHMAWTTREARQRLMNETTENIRGFLAGKPRNLVG